MGDKLIRLWASVAGIGYIKGGGTIAAALAVVVWYGIFGLWINAGPLATFLQFLLTAVIFFLGMKAGDRVEKAWGKDSSRVVIDEVAGQFVSMLLVPIPHTAGAPYMYLVISFVLFRFFDILKPLGIRKLERFAGGFGVMVDDVGAGICANILLQLFIGLFPHEFMNVI